MEANELRIGNILFDRLHREVLIHEIQLEHLKFSLSNGSEIKHNIKTFYPIILTEEWLLKFGFKEIGVNFQTKGIALWYSSYAKSYQLRYYFVGSDIERKINIEYVHQLQNLYFALTGEELTVKN